MPNSNEFRIPHERGIPFYCAACAARCEYSSAACAMPCAAQSTLYNLHVSAAGVQQSLCVKNKQSFIDCGGVMAL